jgi:hypothetical protein
MQFDFSFGDRALTNSGICFEIISAVFGFIARAYNKDATTIPLLCFPAKQ